MKTKVQQIYEGWKNKLLPESALKEHIELISKERSAICNMCPNHSKNKKTLRPDEHCLACGCTLSAKVACLSCSCPIGKWKEAVTDDNNPSIDTDNGGEH